LKYLILVILVGGGICVWLLLTPKALRTGEQAPSFALETVNGRVFDLDTYSDKAVCVVFFSVEDDNAKDLFADFHYVSDQFRGNSDIGFLAIAVDGSPQRVKLFMSHSPFPGPILLDPDKLVAEGFRVSSFPVIYVLDPDLLVSYTLAGWERDYVRELIPALRRASEG